MGRVTPHDAAHLRAGAAEIEGAGGLAAVDEGGYKAVEEIVGRDPPICTLGN